MKLNLLTSLMLAAGALAVPAASFGAAVDLDNCCTAGDKDFPKVGGNLGNQNYSSLKKITRSNVRNLGAAWLNNVDLGAPNGSQSTPVVVDGVIYVETGAGWVIAVDGKTGATKWRVQKTGNTRRGVAVAKELGIVYTLASGNNLVALSTVDGAELWRKSYTGVGNVAKVGLVYNNLNKRLYIGTNDGNFGAGLIVDATNGDQISAFFGVPQTAGDLGYDTWGGAPETERRGATPWVHPAVDPVLNTVYWTFGNVRGGSSQNGSTRPGTNLFGSSVVAVDATTGAYKWHFQMVHHDHWDMDNMVATLVDTKIAGVPRKLLAVTGKLGQFFILDRIDGSAPLGIDEVPVPVDPRQASWPTQPRPRQGAFTDLCAIWQPLGGPIPGHPSRAVPNYPRGCLYAAHWDGAPVLSFPGHGGGADWNASSFSQSTKLIYTGMGYVGASHSLNEGSNGLRPPGEYMTGAVVAVDPATNLVRWKKQLPYSVAHGNGILTTASDLLFIGQPDGHVIAMDATNGRELWRFQTGASISATPITYEIDGEQYIAMYASGTGIPYGNAIKEGDHLYAFKLGANAVPQGTSFMAPLVRRPVSGNPVAGTTVNHTVLLGRTSAIAAEQSINSGSTAAMFPTWMTITPGTTVTFTNPADSVNVHCATQFFEGLFNFSLNPGQSATYTFNQPGEYWYNDCHNPRSTGKIVVSP